MMEHNLADKQTSFPSQRNRTARNSGIELLKIFAIFLIVVSHSTQTLSDISTNILYQEYAVNLSFATTDLQQLIAAILRYSGYLGNTIFFVCSAWFLLDSKRSNKRKILQILADIWVISVGIFIIVFFQRGGQMDGKMILMQFLPTISGNNWYMTCYLLFCLLYPFLNLVLSRIDQKTMLRTCIVLLILYVGFNYVLHGLFFFYSRLILWVTIYFVMAYMKRYLLHSANHLSINLLLLMAGIGGNIAIILITNFLGLRIAFFEDKLLLWNNMSSPVLLLIAIALLNIARNINFRNKFINHISGLSYLIYIIHENMLLRTYYRPMLWEYVYKTFGYEYLLLWILVISLFVFAFGLCSAFLYEQTIQRVITRICNYGYPRVARMWNRLENKLLKLR